MKWQSELSFDPSHRVTLLAAAAGQDRRRHIAQWLTEARQHGRAVWILPCDRGLNGPWAGLIELFGELVPRLQAAAPELLIKHDYELAIVIPTLQRTIAVRNPTLTDVSNDNERTRNYPMDRAYRIVQGLIDLLADAQHALGAPGYALACDDFDHAGTLVKMFVAELIRRKAHRIGLDILVAVDPSASEATAAALPVGCGVRLELAADPPAASPAELARRAEELERQAARDPLDRQMLLAQIVRAWLHSDQPERALPFQIEAFSLHNTRGLYEDALYYGEPAMAALERYTPDALADRMNISVKLYASYIGMNRALEAQQVTDAAMARTESPRLLGQWRYMNAMLYARFLPERDLVKAQQELDRGMVELEQSDLPAPKKAFLKAFNRNGLALVRWLQGHSQEAIDLCQWGYEHLATELGSNDYHLHRSVLIYNIAQVYSTMGNQDEAIRYLTEAMNLDPNYSEYYNERGNLLFRQGRHDEAIADYVRAIELSPPYMEVWTNLGQCYKAMERHADAIEAYARALDIDPKAQLALAGRAQTYDAMGDHAAAITDYDALLALNPAQPEVLANRATLHFERGHADKALADLDHAIGLAPNNATLYENRAVALRALGRAETALSDEALAARLAYG